MYFLDLAVSYELRHFAPFTFLFYPAFISVLLNTKLKYLFIAIFLLIGVWDFSGYFSQREMISENFVEWKTRFVPKDDLNALIVIEKWEEQHPNGIILIDSEWVLSVGARKVDKLVVSSLNNRWIIQSGMELNSPDVVDIEELLENYNKILTISEQDDFEMDIMNNRFEKKKLFEDSKYNIQSYTVILDSPRKDCLKKV